MRTPAYLEHRAKVRRSWLARRERTAQRTRARGGDATPLDVMIRLMQRCCDVIDEEDGRGAAASRRRIDAALKTAAALARSAAPYFHPRVKPTDTRPGRVTHEEALALLAAEDALAVFDD
jgi:hypothetical protein